MERTIKSDMPIWKYIGKGSFTTKAGVIIKSNQVFNALEDDIPFAFRDVIILQNEPKQEVTEVQQDSFYSKQEVIKGWYNVVDTEGKILNEKKLRSDAADELIEELNNIK
ncbi:MAG: hypothetical protein B6I31_05530 [Desulfobacteraceae bacterium 4572_19]|nr:MAG: hypothetical protein B6I31_05530 [Desulfobacteraceae bacterium 4572_19]